ncbi:GGDEF domain-containing protein, partial [Anaerotruncus rubiinfantis]
FKEVNDRFGHFAGDQVLMETAAVLRAVFRKEDVIGRLGGDEFLVFMRRTTSRKLVESKCEMLLERIHGIFPGEDGHPVSVSVGVALSNVGQSFDALYKEADGALYAVKKRGRDSCEIV